MVSDLAGLAFPFAPIQVILLEMFMDLGASTTFIMEPAEADVLNRPPRNPKENLLNMSFNLWVISGAISIFLAVLISYLLGGPMDEEWVTFASSLAFTTWIFGHFLLAFNFRTLREPLFVHGLASNKLMFVWMGAIVLVLVLVLYVGPLAGLMKLTSLGNKAMFIACLIFYRF